MAKKKDELKKEKQEKTILDNTPTEAVKWLKQPVNLTFLRGDMTLAQVNTVVELVDVLQDNINKALSEHSKIPFSESEFSKDGLVSIDVPFNALTSIPSTYRDVEKIAKSLLHFTMTETYTDEKGEKRVKYRNVFESIDVPRQESGYRQGVIRFSLYKGSVESVFALDRYNKYIKPVVKNSKSVFTSRIYMFITAYKAFGSWTPKYEDLHRIFGFSVYEEDPATHKMAWVTKKYPEYRKFRQRVLKTAEAELKDLAEQGSVDCYFDYEEIYPVGKKNGTPDRIKFTIHSTSFGKTQEQETEYSRKCIEIEKYMREELDFRTSDCQQILKRVNIDNADYLLLKMAEVKEYITKNASLPEEKRVKSPVKYAMTSLRNALDDLVPTIQALEEVPSKAAEDVTGYDAGNVPANGEGAESVVKYSAEDKAMYDDVVASLQSISGMKDWTPQMQLREVTDSDVVVLVPTRTFVEVFTNVFKSVMHDAIRDKMGKRLVFVNRD